MKTIFTIKWLSIAIFVFNLQSAILNQQSHNLYAQDPQLFEHTWYLNNLFFDEAIIIPPVNNEIPFVPAYFFEEGYVDTGVCKNTGSAFLEYIGINGFIVNEVGFLQGVCHQNNPFNQEFSDLYQFFWGSLFGNGTIAYEIFLEGNILFLTITSPNGDYAIYQNEIPLSIDSFSNFEFVLYPNPVKNTLTVQNLKSALNNISILIFDINGKLVKSEFIEEFSNDISLNVRELKSGLYFLTIENKDGQKQTLKFIKQ